ncbi:hypothetical protein LCGC14_1164960 [marine sediment metagenome]|uniref:3'-5' exonuclease domain-containing protein n=1 Tax=marine sediment metagenome TaxID=412755 RepID=A0A0F9LWJ7_9ZZZZ
MKLIDTPAFVPKDVALADWVTVMETLHPGELQVSTPELRYSWLKRLIDENVYAHFSVITTPEGMLFWSLLPISIQVETPDGKKITKTQRRPNAEEWAYALAAGTFKKGEINKVRKSTEILKRVGAYLDLLEHAIPTDQNIHQVGGTYVMVDSENLEKISSQIVHHIYRGGDFSWDTETETSGEDDSQAPNPYAADLVGLSIAIEPKHAWYFPVAHRNDDDTPVDWNLPKDKVIHILERAFQLGNAHSILHNIKYDFSVMANKQQNVDIDTVYSWLEKSEDTMLMASLVNEPSAKLKVLAESYFHVDVLDFKKLTGGRSFAYVGKEAATIYAAQDADWTLRLWPIMKKAAEDLHVWDLYNDVEKPDIEYFMRIERRGLLIDREVFDDEVKTVQETLQVAREQFIKSLEREGVDVPPSFNINSGDQLAVLLFSPKPRGLGLPVLSRTKGTQRPSTDDKAMNKLVAQGHDCIQMKILRQYKELAKLLTAYLIPTPAYIQNDGRVHASYHQIGAQTGRTSVSLPNPQQWPENVQKSARVHAILDYQQMELRVLAATTMRPTCSRPSLTASTFMTTHSTEWASPTARLPRTSTLVYPLGPKHPRSRRPPASRLPWPRSSSRTTGTPTPSTKPGSTSDGSRRRRTGS